MNIRSLKGCSTVQTVFSCNKWLFFIYAAVKCLLCCGRNTCRILNFAILLPAGEEVFLNAVPLTSKSMEGSCNEANRNFYMLFSFGWSQIWSPSCADIYVKTAQWQNTRISSSRINTYINIPQATDNVQQNKCVKNKQSNRPLRNKQNPVTITLCILATQMAFKWNTNVQHSQNTSHMLIVSNYMSE